MTKDSRRLPLADWQLDDSDRLKEIFQKKRSALKLTQEKLADGLGDGVTQGAVSHFMNRRTALSLKAVAVFAKMLEVKIEEISPTLARQIEEMGLSTPAETKHSSGAHSGTAANTPFPVGGDTEAADDKYAHIPQYSAKAAAGLGHDNPHVESISTLAFKRDWLRTKGAKAENLLVIYAEGESMWPTINDHDVLLVDQSKIEPADGHVFVLSSTDKGTIVKRLVQSPLGGWIIRSDNEDKEEYGDLLLKRSDVNEHRIIGRVIWRGGDL
ncbi:LexA family transcriptional regulator [Pseudomonas typographi]|uniref:LexA family transcriptional regulator n=1 Tax=Pseudomonas typographi TaxID=2715964 RepID=UPI00168899B1|nr:LexA family transcriptional regulator [Pseudomonas typographi]MBD1554679.1 LexA family transcriptional regulator [Pseudomonas typographi]MBD1589751.1 LexA family transcriptional regulator [Pseudomonas typographi]